MNVKNIVRKAAALGSGAALVGTTLMGAFAYDLSTYPAKYIVDGKFDGKLVVGEKAATTDVLGSIDIAASLQASSVSKVPVPGAAGTVSLSGDNVKVSTSSDSLELREPVGDVLEVITEEDLAGLKSGQLTTSEGSTGYQQYLRLQDSATLQDMAVNYVTNDGEDNEHMADFFVVDTGAPFIEWEVQFDEGFESEIEDDTNSLDDFEDRTLNIMGTDYNIVSAEVLPGGGEFEMILMGGSVPDTLHEGETKTYTIDGQDYEVTLVFVSDPNTGTPAVKFSVNGEITQSMEEGDTDILSGGLQIGVRDILVNSREGVASFYLGADKLTLTDTNTNDTGNQTGSIEINEEVDENDVLEVAGSTSGSTYEITSIKYWVTMESEEGSGGVAYVPAGNGLRALMDEPELLISETLDVRYEGLTDVTTTPVLVRSSNDDEYVITFTNIDGKEYKSVPLLSTDGGFKYGDADDDLVFAENAANTLPGFNVGIDDYFIVTSKTGADAHKAVTNVLRYDEFDADQRTISFEDLAGGTVSAVLDTVGNGTIKVGGHSYAVGVQDVATDDSNVRVDFDGDGTVTNGEFSQITTWGGVVIDLASDITDNNVTAINLGDEFTLRVFNGDGLGATNTNGTGDWTVTMSGTVDESLFDTAGTDEYFEWSIAENAANDELDLSFDDSSYDGPLFDAANEWTEFQFADKDEDDSEHQVAMSDYGILITETDPDSSDDQNTLELVVPEEQRLAQVFVTMGSVTATQGTAGSADRINPIAVGLAVLDSDAPAVGSENLIVVGGPCANTVAAELMGSPANCAEGFEEGRAMIKSWEKTGHVAILVAGYSAMDTRAASKVLASYKDYELQGAEVEVVAADMNSIKVQSAS